MRGMSFYGDFTAALHNFKFMFYGLFISSEAGTGGHGAGFGLLNAPHMRSAGFLTCGSGNLPVPRYPAPAKPVQCIHLIH
jgi:hypothetical protein